MEANLPESKEQSLAELKRTTNLVREATAQRDMQELSAQVSTHDYSITTRDGYQLEARSYRPSVVSPTQILPIYIHFHGGGFLFGTLSSEDAICSRLAINAQAIVFNVNYRHTPEYTYPTAWNDAEDALVWVSENKSRIHGNPKEIVVGGISAGAWLTASLMQAVLRSELQISPTAKVIGQVLMIPCLVYMECYDSQLRQIKDSSVSSYYQNANAPILNMQRKRLFSELLKVENPDPQDKRLNPGHMSRNEAKCLPATTLGIAGYDPLRDEGLLYGKLLAENGHVFLCRIVSGSVTDFV